MIIYKVTNLINAKVYIGQTITTLQHRKSGHISDSNRYNNYFINALNKYGINKFKWEVIRICNDVNELNVWEQYFILYYNSMEVGYNLTSGGLNYIRSEKTKAKLRQANLGKKISEETKEKMRQISSGKIMPESHKKKMSKLQKGSKNSMYGKLGKDNPNYGKKRSKESKQKMRDNHVGFLDKNHSKKTIEKMCKSQKTRWAKKL